MQKILKRLPHLFAIATIVLMLAAIAPFSQNANPTSEKKATVMTTRATGTFDVKIDPQKADNPQAEGARLGRMSIDKQFHGDLEGTSQGEMLSAFTDVKGSGVYVAIERVTGKLKGRSGSFLLHHTGIMTRGEPHLSVTVVPDSGAGELTGISGKMNIVIEAGKHSYEFDYALPN